MNISIPIVLLVASVATFALYWRVAEQLLPAVFTVQVTALKFTANRNERWQRLALAFVASPLSSLVGKFAYPKYWMAAKLYQMRTTEQSRQRRAFRAMFSGLEPEPTDAIMQRMVTGTMISLSMSIRDQDCQLQMLATIEQTTGKSTAGLAGAHRVQMGMQQIDFDYARSAASYFGYTVADTWQNYIDQIATFLADADVMPCLEYHWYRSPEASLNSVNAEGIKIFPSQGGTIVNFSQEHIETGSRSVGREALDVTSSQNNIV